VREYASRVIALYEGRIIADGNPRDVFADVDVVRFITGTVAMPSSPGAHYASA
jgi:branched-chain amino acid transport system ATP-binding protein